MRIYGALAGLPPGLFLRDAAKRGNFGDAGSRQDNALVRFGAQDGAKDLPAEPRIISNSSKEFIKRFIKVQ
jgi:hypothetical protein